MRKTRKSELKQVFKRFSYKAMIASLIVTNVIPMATPAMTAFAAEVETYTPYSNSSYNWVVSADGNWQYDIVDGDTSKCIVKPYSDAMKTGAVVIPDSIDGYVPVGVYADAWADNTEITSVTLPDTVTEIGENAFKGCTALASINLQNVHVIGKNAFNGCTSLTSIEVGSLNDLHYSTFADCSQLADVKIGDIGTYHIYTYNNSTVLNPFSGTAVKNIELGNIGKVTNDRGSSYGASGMFYGLTGLETITIGDIPSIGGEFAFHNCTSLKSLTVGNVDKVTSINGEFYYESSFPTSLETLKFGDIGEIQNSAFEGLSSLTSFEAGNVGKIDTAAFAGGWRWNGEINGTITTECDFKFGEIGSIGYYAFANRTNLSDDNLTYTSVESINKTAFDSTQISLKTVTLNTNDGTGTVTTKSVVMGTRGANIGKAEWDGKVFTGWYEDAECTKPFTGQVLSDMTLYAGWIDRWYYVDADGNEVTGILYDQEVSIAFDDEMPVGEITYQWRFYETFNGTTYHLAIPGETSQSCTPTKEKLAAAGSSGIKGSIFCFVYSNGYQLTNSTSILLGETEDEIAQTLNSLEITTSGSVADGYVLTATPDPSNAVGSYQWLISDTEDGEYTEISGATSKTYTLTNDDYGKYIKVKFTGSSGYAGQEMTSEAVTISFADVDAVSIDKYSYTKYVGDTLSTTISGDSAGHVTYQWYRSTTATTSSGKYGLNVDLPSTAEAIDGATGSTYDVTVEDRGYYIFVVVTGIEEDGFTGSYVSKSTSNVVKAKLTDASISGDYYVGENLEAIPNPYVDDGTYTYQWYRSSSATSIGSTISGATEKTYTLTEDDVDKYIHVKVSATIDGTSNSKTVYSSVAVAAERTALEIDDVTIAGDMKVGGSLSVTVSPEDATVDYQWQISDSADGAFSDISGATRNSYSPTADDAGKFIRVVITGTGDYDDSSYTSTPQEVIDLDISINVSGTARVGNTLSVSVDDADAEMTYRWLRCASKGGVYAVVGTGSSYTLTEDDGGMYIKIIGTGTSSGGADIKLESEAVKVKKVINSIGIVGIPKVGEVLEVVTDPTDATGDIQWLIGDTSTGTFSDISGATDAEYTIASSDAGKWLAVKFTSTGDYEGITITLSTGSSGNSSSQTIYTEDTDSESIEVKWELESTTDGKDTSDSVTNNSSSSSGSSDNDNNNNTGGSSSSGSTSSVGSVLKGPEVEDGVTGNYKWYYKDEDGNWIGIEGVTGDSLTITEDYAGKTIKSEFKGTDKDGNDIYLYTTPVYVPLDGNGGTGSNGRILDSKEEVFYTELDTDEVYAGANKKVEVYVSQGQSVAVRLPFQVTADGRKGVENKADFEIEVRANISGADTVKVIPESELELTTVGKNPIKATVEQDQTEFSILYDGQESLELGKIVNGRVTVHDLSAGFWEGYYNYTIIVEGAKTSDSEESSENIEVTP